MDELNDAVATFASLLLRDRDGLVDAILERVWRDGVPNSPFSRDPALQAVVWSETAMLVTRLVEGLSSVDLDQFRAPEAGHIARLAFLHELPLDALLGSYRIAQQVLQDMLFQCAREADIPPTLALEVLEHSCRKLSREIAAIMQMVTDEYAEAVEAGGADENAVRLHAVRAVLSGETTAAEDLAYDLTVEHVAVVARGPVARALATVAEERGAAAFSLFVDCTIAWAWFSRSGPDQIRADVMAHGLRGLVGVGAPGCGPAGFRQSHLEAQSAYRVCERTGWRSACFADVIPEAIGLADVDAARGLVQRRLGRLAGGGSREGELRRTLMVYLSSGQTARSAAAKLGLTERTVANRLQAVRALLPDDTELSSLELALALRLRPLVCNQQR